MSESFLETTNGDKIRTFETTEGADQVHAQTVVVVDAATGDERALLTDTELRASPVPIADGGGSITVDGPLTDAQLRATAVPIADGGGSLTVDGPLTDAQLRATAVPIADGGGSITVDGPVTDAQLRAAPIDVSGPLTDAQLRATAVPIADGGGSITVDGPLTDVQLRASAVVIADGGGSVTVDGPLTDVQLRASPVPIEDGGGSLTVDGPLTDAELRAATVVTRDESPRQVTGTIDAAGESVAIELLGSQGVGFKVVITGSILLKVERSMDDGATFIDSPVMFTGTGVPVGGTSGISQNGTGWFVIEPGTTHVRIAHEADGGGSASVILSAGPGRVDASVGMVYGAAPTRAQLVAGEAPDGTLKSLAVEADGSVIVTGPLTDAELRATAVPVSGPLTNAELRAFPVDVTGAVAITNPGDIVVTVDETETATQTLDALNEYVFIDVSLVKSVGFYVAPGSFDGTLQVQASYDNVFWTAPRPYFKYAETGLSTWKFATTIVFPTVAQPVAGVIIFDPGVKYIRVRVSAYTSGSADVSIFGGKTDQNHARYATSPNTVLPIEAAAIAGSDGTNAQVPRVFDLDTGGGAQYALGVNLRRSGSGGSAEMLGQGTKAQSLPVVLASDQDTLAVSGPLTDAQLRATAVPVSGPLTDAQLRATAVPIADGGGSITVDGPLTDAQLRASAVPISATQLPAALVGARLDINNGAWLGSTAPTVGQKTMANSLPVAIASDQGAVTVAGGAANGAAVAGNPNLVAGSDGTNARTIRTNTAGRLETVSPTSLFVGRSCTFRTAGRAGTSGQKILSLYNAGGSAVTVTILKAFIDLMQTVVKAVTVAPPILRLWKITAAPTNGTVLAKNKIGGSTTSNASVEVRGDASADGTGSGTTLTATLPAGTFITQEFAPRLITAAGYEPADRIEWLGDTTVELAAGEGVVVFLDYVLATQNPTTDMWIAGLEWKET